MKIALGIFLGIHGFAHLIGFLVPWKIATLKEMPYSTKIFYQKYDIGSIGVRITGLLWLAATLLFFTTSFYLISGNPQWMTILRVSIYLSSLLCIIGLPDARIGFLVNFVLFLFLVLNTKFMWII